MTSKEALDTLHRLSLISVKPKSKEEAYRRKLRNIIEKDLDILEIILNHSKIVIDNDEKEHIQIRSYDINKNEKDENILLNYFKENNIETVDLRIKNNDGHKLLKLLESINEGNEDEE